MLPTRTEPDFFYNLYLDNLYNLDLTKKICISTNSNNCPLLNKNNSFSYIYTGDQEAVSIGKTLAGNPSSFKNIPGEVIPAGVVLSRQLIGTNFNLKIVTFNGLVATETSIFTGQIGKVTQRNLSVDLELISDSSRLTTTSRFKTSTNCMNTLGEGKCTVNREPVILAVVGISGDTFQIGTGFIFNSGVNYEVIVGTTRYLVDRANSSTSLIKVVGTIQGQPQLIIVQKHCNRTINTCSAVYSNLAQFNGNILLKSDGLVVNI
jgi:hypothetical protein